jgi:hypothetical protein
MNCLAVGVVPRPYSMADKAAGLSGIKKGPPFPGGPGIFTCLFNVSCGESLAVPLKKVKDFNFRRPQKNEPLESGSS